MVDYLVTHDVYPTYILYDDMCHLAAYARDEERRNYSEGTKRLANTNLFIDKLHFKVNNK